MASSSHSMTLVFVHVSLAIKAPVGAFPHPYAQCSLVPPFLLNKMQFFFVVLFLYKIQFFTAILQLTPILAYLCNSFEIYILVFIIHTSCC